MALALSCAFLCSSSQPSTSPQACLSQLQRAWNLRSLERADLAGIGNLCEGGRVSGTRVYNWIRVDDESFHTCGRCSLGRAASSTRIPQCHRLSRLWLIWTCSICLLSCIRPNLELRKSRRSLYDRYPLTNLSWRSLSLRIVHLGKLYSWYTLCRLYQGKGFPESSCERSSKVVAFDTSHQQLLNIPCTCS